MLALCVILTILGVIGVAYGAWSAGAVRAGTDFLGISSIFFGTVVLIAGAAFLYSGRNEARRAHWHAVGAKEFTSSPSSRHFSILLGDQSELPVAQ